jgi:hypothetical protein
MMNLVYVAVVIFAVFAGYNVATSSVDTPKKVAWIVLIVLLPFVGALIWAFIGPRGKKLF